MRRRVAVASATGSRPRAELNSPRNASSGTRWRRARHSILETGLAVGVVWGAWHFTLFWQGDSFSAPLPLAILLIRLFSWLPPFRVLLVWVHDRTQSLPVVMFMRAVVSFTSLTFSPETLNGACLLTSLLVSAGTMWLLLATVGVLATGPPAPIAKGDE